MTMKSSSIKIRDASGWTIFIFGMLAFLFGLIGLIRPEMILSTLGFELANRAARASSDYTIVFITASSMASFNIGIYYMLAAVNDVKIFYRWTVPFRVVTFTVFTILVIAKIAPLKFIGVGIWELAGALSTGIALYIEDRKAKEAVIKTRQSPRKSRKERLS